MNSLSNASLGCPNGSRWIMEIFNECAQDGWDVASVVLGLVSILCFAAASFPQFYLACKTGIMDQALSLYFLLGWLGGDSLNLIGSFLADQLPLQVYTAIYYVLADLLMISLYIYYKIKNQDRRASASINAILAFILFGTVSAAPFLGQPAFNVDDGTPIVFRGRTLLSSAEDSLGWESFTKKEIVGFVIGSVSSVLYLASRIPQIYTNFKRKSTTGISYSLFALVMLGNSLYGLSVLMKNPNPGQSEGSYVIHHLPWLVGSLGVLSLDIVISFQFLAYRKKTFVPLEEREALLSSQDDPQESGRT
ncbi:lysosomal amino acid transporter 1 homolog [Sceloporus undulatus]|uniref:lysosomal amino acid transporter 1 homolog n=1 Tax=Sceloporus undulatus TaxID=8520 RepID=UPI001C4BFEFA|nr:lysosomal amino acid transporter 1 homolog [Sceloporus undulatus]XP_042333945.1 lysosomal amino acid transporter 1 homolog [Sceloporus undulatus]XP_042333946.1 lysosomal amino acid transporter 1 homolog [Sceloporus undulatus]XP_042333947.1 lysosomal amino acid transporter 1 homolog [Sceloporus undulatus]XP_042333948.1 lysosomal amino acid transporter 1 homolog [Sceloporus undulatus]